MSETPPQSISQIREEQIRRWAATLARRPQWGYLVLIAGRVFAQAWGAGFLFFALLMALFGDSIDYQRTHWNNVFVTVVLTLIGFYVSDLACRAAQRAGLTDWIGSWSYTIGILITGILYLFGWRS